VYADRAVLLVRFVEERGVPAEEVWEVTAERPDFDFMWLYEEARSLATPEGAHRPSVVDVRANRTDWGGDSGTFEVALTVSKWVLDQGATAAFGYAFSECVSRMRTGPTAGLEGTHLSRQEATERARWKVAAAYKIDADRLSITSEEISGDSWTIGLADAGQATYEVTLAQEEGLVVTTRIKRTLDPGTAAAS
jgi:hypothetical protein